MDFSGGQRFQNRVDPQCCGLRRNRNAPWMKMSGQRIISMALLIVALAMFLAMNFLPMTRFDENELGWRVWQEIWQIIQDPAYINQWSSAVGLSSFFTFSLLTVASPFLGNVWVKSLLAWSISVTFSGVAAAGFWLMIFQDGSTEGFVAGGWCLMISPGLNFAGLLLARTGWRENRPFAEDTPACENLSVSGERPSR